MCNDLYDIITNSHGPNIIINHNVSQCIRICYDMYIVNIASLN